MSDVAPKRPRRLRLVLVGIVVLPIVVVGALSPPSPSGGFYLLALLLMWLGPSMARRVPERSARLRRPARFAGYGLFGVVLSFRLLAPQGETFRYEQVGEGSVARTALARFANERDLSGGASTLLNTFSLLPERGGILGPLFRGTYDLMDEAGESAPSPLVPTLLLGQSPASFDLLRYRIDAPRGTLVFLHGYGGNIASICWELAQSAKAAGFETLCPSTGTPGDWGSARGGEILSATLDEVSAEGPIVLAGLSAGARGAAVLAPRFRERIEGLVLIAGAASRAGRAGVPTMVIYGRHDAMFSPRVIRGYIERTGAQAVALDGGHFIVLGERERVRSEITRFLDARQSPSPVETEDESR